MPYSAANERLKPSPVFVDQIQVQVDDVNNVALVQQNITTLLRTRYHLRDLAPSSTGKQFGGGSSNPLRGLGGGGFGGGGRGGGGGFGGGGNPNGGQQTGRSTTPRSNSTLRGVPQANDFQVFSGNQLVQTAQQNTAELAILL